MAPINPENTARQMPDIASDASPSIAGQLDWVGMGDIEAPIRLADPHGAVVSSVARVNAFVNLCRPEARGIHMSRLYLHVDRCLSGDALSPTGVRHLLKEFLASHGDLSDRAMLQVRFDYLLRRSALVSDNSGWKSYPIIITGVMDRGQFTLELSFSAAYSSTCPCSAALARQLIQDRFRQDFVAGGKVDFEAVVAWLGTEEGICATPHSQRSSAEIKVRLVPSFQSFPIADLIDCIEGALKTPVQAAVKREDEQAFALLNGANLMFCEDAARRMQAALNDDERVVDFWLRASHFESLHPHNAVAVATKGVPGGFSPALL